MSAPFTRRVVVTGGSRGGLGYEAARKLVAAGHHVLLTFRDADKAEAAMSSLRREIPQPATPGEALGLAGEERLAWVRLDLDSLDSVRQAGAEITAKWPHIDALLLNAAVVESGRSSPRITKDGFESTYQVNHLAGFLLTQQLLPALARSRAPNGARIVVVSSELHQMRSSTLPADPQYAHTLGSATAAPAQPFKPLQVYGLSKLCNLWFAFKLSRMLAASSLPVTVDAVTPGWVPTTNLGKSNLSWFSSAVMSYVLPLTSMATTREEGTKRMVDALFGACAHAGSGANSASGERAPAGAAGQDEAWGSGRYFAKGAIARPSDASLDTQLQDQLWELSCRATGLAPKSYLPKR